jgi:hypothetical protein
MRSIVFTLGLATAMFGVCAVGISQRNLRSNADCGRVEEKAPPRIFI